MNNNYGLLKLNPRYTFDNFVEGPCNEHVLSVAKEVANDPGNVYNPLYIQGGTGLGKTHLLYAIGNEIAKGNPQIKCAYTSIQMFARDMAKSLMTDDDNAMEDFRAKYRNVDVLLIDDIQFLVGKEQTQVEFFHMFNDLTGRDKQLVIAGDRDPKRFCDLPEQITSRLSGGVMLTLCPYDFDTRVEILKEKAKEEGLTVDDEMTKAIEDFAEKNKFDIRELKGEFASYIVLR